MTLTLDPTEVTVERLIRAIERALGGQEIRQPVRLGCGYLHHFHGAPAAPVCSAVASRGGIARLNEHFAPRGLRFSFERGVRAYFVVSREQ